ncbi:VanZ family protein [Leifsonia naganoensis]|uniref:Glycopeptide antibiotics resistance protein n=1 Tax=Leifsonia naganoensis TaxID=150025 RepID=A0A853DKY2_9MICO|nr:VanZ family protein [Leifsonia naganoensis]NYK08243.1 glycopeptide antibiotics resistance protein [Leifsonia naganoensis]
MPRRVLAAVTAVYLLVVAWITLNPFPPDPHGNRLLTSLLALFADTPLLAWVTYDVVEFSANIVMFVPMGVLLTLLLGREHWWLALALGVVATLTIEFVQLFLPARFSDPRDLLANTLGTVVGIAIVLVASASRVRRARTR